MLRLSLCSGSAKGMSSFLSPLFAFWVSGLFGEGGQCSEPSHHCSLNPKHYFNRLDYQGKTRGKFQIKIFSHTNPREGLEDLGSQTMELREGAKKKKKKKERGQFQLMKFCASTQKGLVQGNY